MDNLTCPKEGHDNAPIETICCNEGCELQSLNCLLCLLEDHQECNESMIRVEDLMNDNIEMLFNWYDSPIITEIATVN